jgi:hypothetical protein
VGAARARGGRAIRVLITNDGLDRFGGTETYARTIAEQLQRTGHDVILHGYRLGPFAQTLRDRGLRVVAREDLPDGCDLLLTLDAGTAIELAPRYPDAARIFVAHSVLAGIQCPPQLPGACQAVVALNDRTLQWARSLGHAVRCERLRQPVDLDRFRLTRAPENGSRRVLVLSNYPFGTRGENLSEACRQAGLELRWKGFRDGQTATPEAELSDAHMTIGLGRSVLDGMAAARAAFVFGPLGGDGWVTSASYAELEADGFAGRATDRMFDMATVARELSEWDPELGLIARDLVARHHDVRDHVTALVDLAGDLRPEAPSFAGVEDELARLVRMEWQRHVGLVHARAENNRLAGDIGELSRQLATAGEHAELAERDASALRAALVASDARLQQVLATRRWRVAARLGRPLDVLRARLRDRA